MNQQDLQQIKGVINGSIEKFAQATVKPGFDDVSSRLNKVEDRFGGVENRLDKMESDVNRLPDKAYLDKKFMEFRGDVNLKFKKSEKKIEILTESQKRKQMLNDMELNELKELNIFPRLQDLKPVE